MNTHVYAYLAGVVDSDGYIGIDRRRRYKRGEVNPSWTERLVVNQTHSGAIELCKSTFGGLVYTRPAVNGRRKPLLHWELSALAAANALRLLYPYLRNKRGEADLVFLLRANKDLRAGKRLDTQGNVHRLLPEIVAYRDGLHAAIRNLHGNSGHRQAKLL